MKEGGVAKARLVIKGFLQKYQIDYEETFAPVSKLTSLRMFFAIANQYNMVMHQMDVKTAFLNAELDNDIYIEIPEHVRIEDELHRSTDATNLRQLPHSELVLKVNRAIYGLKQAPRLWYQKIDKYLKSIGYHPLPNEPCIYFCDNSKSKHYRGMLVLYVDDMVLASNDKLLLNEIKDKMHSEYEMKDLVPVVRDTRSVGRDAALGFKVGDIEDGWLSNAELLGMQEEGSAASGKVRVRWAFAPVNVGDDRVVLVPSQ
jgi:hypothetical protein